MADIDSALASGYKTIVLCAPTGAGKSHVAMALAMHVGSSYVLTAQKILQDQYASDFAWASTMKGKANFPCIDLYDHSAVPYEAALTDASLACTNGNCSWQVDDNAGRKRTEYCSHKPIPGDYSVIDAGTERERVVPTSRETKCYYYDQKYRALNASHAIFNYASYFYTRKYSRGLEELVSRKRCIIADEAHEIEDQVIDVIGMDVRRAHLHDVGLTFEEFDTGDVDGVRKMVEYAANLYHQKVTAMDGDGSDKKIALFKKRRDDLDSIHFELAEHPDNMIVQQIDGGGVSIKPVEIAEHAGRFFDAEYRLFMSATIHRDLFCAQMGIDPDSCAFIEVGRSPFALEHRRVEFLNTRRLSMRSTPGDYAAIYSEIGRILKRHAGQKGLILTTRKDQCSSIASALAADPEYASEARRIRIVHTDTGEQRERALADHAETEMPQVLASPSLWYGVDLKGDLSRFQIILKAPYLSLGDSRTKAKSQKSQQWYLYASLTKLLQGMGRSVRSEDDHAVTYVLDGAAQDLVRRMRRFVPGAYEDMLGLGRAA